MLPSLEAEASPGNRLEIQILQPHPKLLSQTLGAGPSHVGGLISHAGDSNVWVEVSGPLAWRVKFNHFITLKYVCHLLFIFGWGGHVGGIGGVGPSQHPPPHHNDQQVPKVQLPLWVSHKTQFNSHTLFLPVHSRHNAAQSPL